MNKITIICVLILAVGCGGSGDIQDLSIWSQDSILMKMTEDIHVAEVASRVYDDNNRDSVYRALKNEIYQIYGKDSAAYQMEMDSLSKNPARYLSFYKKLTERMDSINKLSRNRN